MLSKEEIKEALYECKDGVVIGLWNKCANEHNYEEVFINDVGFFYDCIVRGGNHWEFAESVFNGEYRTKDKYAWFNSNRALMSFNRPCDELSPVDFDVLAIFIHERYDLIEPSDLFDIEINNKED
jgi:hypothetical protein